MAGNFDAIQAMGQVGSYAAADGTIKSFRLTKTGAQVVGKAHGDFSEGTSRGRVFSVALAATTTGVAAGNIVAAAAAAATQFAIFNPANSGKDVHLLKFAMGVVSGTPAGGSVFHGIFGSVPTVASIGGVVRSNYGGAAAGSVVIPQVLAAGSALTGGPAPATLRASVFAFTATAQATVGVNMAQELIDGDIILPPGTGWAPLHPAAGTSLLHSYSVTWEEVDRP